MTQADSMIHNAQRVTLNSYAHGGNVYRAARDLGIPVEDIIDCSASINPLGISDGVREVVGNNLNRVVHYPDTEASELRVSIADHLGISAESILCGNGSTELIYLIPRVLKPENVLIPTPTFSEYERACRLCRGEALPRPDEPRVRSYELREEDKFEIITDEFIAAIKENSRFKIQDSKPDTERPVLEASVAFLCNPNNPTGHLLKRAEVLRIAAAARQMKCYLVVDEAFIDFVPEESVIKDVKDNPYLIVLRSMTKFYALTGLRIGYGVFHESLKDRILSHKEPWTVNTLAQKAAIEALQDTEYAGKTHLIIAEEKRFFETEFRRLGIRFFPSQANYYMLQSPYSKEITAHLFSKGILVRDCSNFRGLDDSYIRVAVRLRRDNELLLRELEKICRA